MKTKKVVVSLLLCALVFFAISDSASAHGRIIFRPWVPWPLIVFPVGPPPPPPPPPPPIIVPQPVVVAPPVATPPPPPPDTGFIDLDARPADALVDVDGTYRGIADNFDGIPSYLELSPGQHRIALRKDGYSSVSFIVNVQAGQVLTFDVVLDPVIKGSEKTDRVYQLDIEKTGYVEIDVQPSDAAIYVDGAFYGTAAQFKDAPDTLLLKTGKHRVEILRPGYEGVSDEITVDEKQVTKLKVTLKKKG